MICIHLRSWKVDNKNHRHQSDEVISDLVLDRDPRRYLERAPKMQMNRSFWNWTWNGRGVQPNLLYFGHVLRGNTCHLAHMVMEGAMEDTRSRDALQGNGGWTTFWNGAFKPTKNARCWHKIGTVGERCPGSSHYHCHRTSSENHTLRWREDPVFDRLICQLNY